MRSRIYDRLAQTKRKGNFMLWSELSKDLQTGDIILFHQDGLISRLIDIFTDAHFSHVGMVVRQSENPETEQLMFWQSFEPEGGVVLDKLPDFLTEYLTKYKGTFVCRHLNVERSPEMVEALNAFMTKVKGRPFPSIWGMLSHWLEGKLGIDSGEKSFFCSDLVADSYINMGVLPQKPPPNFYAPKNFATSKDMHFLLDANFSEQIPFELDPPSAGEGS